jgi:hypothetical protein
MKYLESSFRETVMVIHAAKHLEQTLIINDIIKPKPKYKSKKVIKGKPHNFF